MCEHTMDTYTIDGKEYTGQQLVLTDGRLDCQLEDLVLRRCLQRDDEFNIKMISNAIAILEQKMTITTALAKFDYLDVPKKVTGLTWLLREIAVTPDNASYMNCEKDMINILGQIDKYRGLLRAYTFRL